jgi:hypothetical protein
MSRDAHIPLVLWISAAILGHLAGGSGAVEMARVFEDRADVRAFVRGVRSELRPGDKIFELMMDGVEATPSAQPSEAPDKDGEPSDEQAEADAQQRDPAEPKPTDKDEQKPEDQAQKPPEPEKEKEKVQAEAVPPQPAKPVAPNAPLQTDKRIAIKQNVEKNQKDNPNATRIADDAHTTDEETQARIRSHDQDSPDPTPGAHAGPRGEVGDGEEDKSGHSEDKKGDPNHAPGEAKEASQSPQHNDPAPPNASKTGQPSSPTQSKPGGARAAVPAAPASPPPAPGGAGPASPDTMQAERGGGYSLDPANPGGDGKSRAPGRKRGTTPYKSPVNVRSMGLGAEGAPGKPNPNVKLTDVIAGVGEKQLKAERAADGASRRSKHRGSWETNKFERWRAAIENYEPSVKVGNQTSLNAARVPFATYINSIHNRLHPIFAEEFLASLDNLPRAHDLNKDLVTHIEIVLSKDEGRIVRMGVTKASGETAFDVVALNSVHRASPYGKAPQAIVSPDGNVYLHWEFHRDPFDACTTRNARPFLLKSPPTLSPTMPPSKRPPSLRPGDDGRGPAPLLPLRQK